MKRLAPWLLLCPAWAFAAVSDPQGVLTEANAAYQAGEYEKAAELYATLARDGFSGVDLFYNLGTARLRAGARGEAILWFERALRLEPHDEDVLFNLAEAQKGNIDKVVGAREEIPFIERVGTRVPVDTTATVLATTWLLGLGLLALRRFVSSGRGLLFALGLSGLLVAVVAAVLLSTVWWTESRARWAVVTKPATAVREGPAADFRTAFEIHEGLKVRVVREERGFLRVRLPNGVEGWVDGADVPQI